MRLEKIIDLRGRIELLTGLRIGAGDLEMRIGGVDNAVIRNPRNDQPYIPGSSLKGKIRSLLEWRSGAVKAAPLGLSDLEAKRGDIKRVKAILQLFGVSGDSNLTDESARLIGPTRLSFHDAVLISDPEGSNLPITEVKSENQIDRIRGIALNPRQTERVVAGVSFDFRVAIKVLEGDAEVLFDTLLEGLKLLELDSLGGSGSRGYGKVRFLSLSKDGVDIQPRFDALDPFKAA
jgi:CRISPR-associated protein Csm3